MEAVISSRSRLAPCLKFCMFVGLLLGAAEAVPSYPPIITCATSGRSPTYNDALEAAKYITNLGDNTQCCNNNCRSSVCTTMGYVGTAAVGLCTEAGQCNMCMPCGEAGGYLERVVRQCQMGGLTGGSYEAVLDENNFYIDLIVFNYKDT
ncbi:hypothetical protein Mapa_013790 [Marchantia paleacea]|nr:hypothetical protein Mapa_013790 [Marchantia paleacea]